jgi:hypothetical protein
MAQKSLDELKPLGWPEWNCIEEVVRWRIACQRAVCKQACIAFRFVVEAAALGSGLAQSWWFAPLHGAPPAAARLQQSTRGWRRWGQTQVAGSSAFVCRDLNISFLSPRHALGLMPLSLAFVQATPLSPLVRLPPLWRPRRGPPPKVPPSLHCRWAGPARWSATFSGGCGRPPMSRSSCARQKGARRQCSLWAGLKAGTNGKGPGRGRRRRMPERWQEGRPPALRLPSSWST